MTAAFATNLFNATYYLQNNADVLSAIAQGRFTSALQHFELFGRYENRSPNVAWNATQYMIDNPDVASAVGSRSIASAWDHFTTFGYLENRSTGTFTGTFNAAAYLAANPDVQAAVTAGSLSSAYEHFILFGDGEGRAATNTAGTSITMQTGSTFTLTTGAPSVTEGDAGQKALTFTLTLSEAPTMEVVVNYQTLTSGTATAGDDFGVAAGTVTFAVGQRTATVTVNVLGDTAVEANETVQVQFSGSRLVASVTATGTITNDDTANAPIGAVSDTNGAANSVAENVAQGTVVGITASATDATAGETVSYALTTNPGNLFAIDATTGVVTVNGALDFETAASHSITVRATSSDGSTSNENFTVAVTDVAENVGAVTDGNAAANSVAENVAQGTVVGITASATDPQAGDTVSYALTSNPGNLFAIDAATGVVTVAGALDFETAASHSITVQATSSDGSTSNANFTVAVTDVAEAQTFTLTTGTDRGAAFTGGAGDDTFVAGDDAGAQTFTIGDQLDGGDGTDAFVFSSHTAISTPSQIKVTNIESATVSSDAGVTLNTSAWTGLTSLDVTGVGALTLTGAATTDLTATISGVTDADGGVSVQGGENITLALSGTATVAADAAAEYRVGNTKAAAGTVTVTNNFSGVNGTRAGDIETTGGTSVSVTQAVGNAVNTTVTQGTVTVLGNADTTAVTVANAAIATASATVAGVVANSVTITDVNNQSTTAAGTITSATVSNYTTLSFSGNALTTLSVTGGSGNIIIDNSGLTTATNKTLGVTVNGLTGGTLDDADIYTTLNVTGTGAASTLANSTFGETKTLNVDGTAAVTLSSIAGLSALTSVTSTNSAGLTLGSALGTAVTFTGGDGADSVIIGATTKTIATGAGNDTVTVGVTALGTGGSINAGDGTADVLKMTTSNAETASATGTFEQSISGFERLTVSDSAASATINLGNLDDINYVTSSGSAGTLTLTNAQSGFTLVQTAAATTGHTITLADATGSADSISVKITGAATIAAGTITANSIETIAIESDDTTTPDGTVNHTATLTAGSVKSLTVSGDALLTLTNTSTTLTSVDAAAMTNAFSGLVWASVGTLAAAATLTGGSGNDNIGGTANAATKNLVMTGGDGQDTLGGGDGNDTITDTSSQTNGNGNSLIGGAGNDTITAGAGIDTIDGGTGNDSIVAGGGNDVLTGGGGSDTVLGGEGEDAITAASGAESLDGGAGNDSYAMATYWGSTDVIADESGAADTLTVTAGDSAGGVATTTAGTTSGIEKITADYGTDADVLALASVSGLTTLTLTGSANTAVATVTGLNSGATVVVSDADVDTVSIDTAASATVTVEQNVTSGATLGITDAATVTITNTSATAGVVTGTTTLDSVDTTSLTIAAGSKADLTLAAIAGTDKLASATLTAQVDGQDLAVTSIADADSLTSLTLTASAGDVTLTTTGASGAGNAENLATITATGSNGGIVTLTNVYADETTDSDTDLAMTITASAEALSKVALGTITNTYGTITATLSGAGETAATKLYADDLTLTWSSGTASTITTLTATDDATITNSGSAAHTISTMTVGDDVTITHTGSAALTITTVTDGIGNLVIDASDATGAVSIGTNSQSSTTEAATMTGGSGADSLEGGASNDSLTGGSGNDTLVGNGGADTLSGGANEDSLDGGAGNDSLLGGDANDTITVGIGLDYVDGGAGDDTIAMETYWGTTDTIDGGDGTDKATFSMGNLTFLGKSSNVEAITVTATDDGGIVDMAGLAGVVTVNLLGTSDDDFTVRNIVSGSTVNIDNTEVGDITLDTASSATLTVDVGATTLLVAGDITITDATSVTLNVSGGASAATVVHTLADGAGLGDVSVDTADTTTLNITTSAYAGLAIDEILTSNKLATLSITTATGEFLMDDMVDATSLATLTLSANGSDAGDITIGDIGTDAGADAAGSLKTVSLTAADGADIAITLIDGDTAATDAAITSFTAAANTTGSTIAVTTIDVATGSLGTVSLSAVSGASVTLSSVVAASVSSLTTSGAGTFTIDLSDVTDAVTVTLGAGTNTLTSGEGSDVITLSTSTSTDTIKYDGTGQGQDSISNFNSADDTITFSYAAFSTGSAVGAAVQVAGNAGTPAAFNFSVSDIGYVLKTVNTGASSVEENELTDASAVSALIDAAFVQADGDATAIDQAIFVIEASDVDGVFGLYAYTASGTNDTSFAAGEFILLGVVTGDDLAAANLTMF